MRLVFQNRTVQRTDYAQANSCAAFSAGLAAALAATSRPIRRAGLPLLVLMGLLVSLLASATAYARELPADPLESVMWESMAERFMPDGEIVFDERVRVMAPISAENQFHVPVTVDASQLDDVQQIVVVADLNPIPLVLNMRPEEALSFIGFRLKLQQTSPIHVGVKTGNGVWHVGYAIVDAAGGGCTAPAAMHATSNWMKTLGETRAVALRTDVNTKTRPSRCSRELEVRLKCCVCRPETRKEIQSIFP